MTLFNGACLTLTLDCGTCPASRVNPKQLAGLKADALDKCSGFDWADVFITFTLSTSTHWLETRWQPDETD